MGFKNKNIVKHQRLNTAEIKEILHEEDMIRDACLNPEEKSNAVN